MSDSVGNLESLKILDLVGTNLKTLPESMGNLTNLENLRLSRYLDDCMRIDFYSSSWKDKIIQQSLAYWSLPPLTENGGNRSSLDWSNKNLTQLQFCIWMLTNLEELDIRNNQITKIPRLLKNKKGLKKLYLHNNPNLNHLPDFLWSMNSLKELKIDGKLVKDLPKNAEYHLDNDNLEDNVLGLTLAGKNKAGMSDQDLSNKTEPYIVHLRR
ncbi:MAG: hypothetical protein K5780_00335 [Alphaproteobacteria bacterium]|nr:hypothetical protein [Alphaproteobacteria bacterium]